MAADFASWLRAQLDADEATARAVEDNSAPWDGQWKADGPDCLRTYNDWVLFYGHTHPLAPGLVNHVARHDPARVLADIAAKRRAIGNHQADGNGCCRTCAHWTSDWVDGHKVDRLAYEGVRAPCLTLRLLGLAYADRAGYDESWRP